MTLLEVGICSQLIRHLVSVKISDFFLGLNNLRNKSILGGASLPIPQLDLNWELFDDMVSVLKLKAIRMPLFHYFLNSIVIKNIKLCKLISRSVLVASVVQNKIPLLLLSQISIFDIKRLLVQACYCFCLFTSF